MSTLQFLREKAGIVVAGIIGFSLFLFVVSDFFGNGRGQRIKARKYYEIGKVGDQYISYQDFEKRIQNLIEIYKLSGNTNLTEAATESLREQVWQQMVRETILDNQYKKLGVGVSNEELDELVLGNNPHPIVLQLFTDQKTGTFNKSFLVNFLKQTEVDETAKKYWLFFEDEIVNDRMSSKYNTLVAKGLYVTGKEAEFEKNLTSNTVDFSFVMKNYSSVPDSFVKFTSGDMENYYTRHKNSFKRNALRDIEYVSFEVTPSDEDIKQAEDWINKNKPDFAAATDPVQFINLSADTRFVPHFVTLNEVPAELKDFARKEDLKEVFGPYNDNGTLKIARLIAVADRPDSVHAKHILLSVGASRTLDQAKHIADSLATLIKKGTSFETLAMTNSDDKGTAQLGGDLGWFPEGRMITPFNDACFTGKKGDLLTVETTFGVHIIKIADQSKPVRKYEIGIVDRKINAGSMTNQSVYSQASQFAGTNNTFDKFEKAVTDQKLNKQVVNDVTPQQKSLPGLDNPRGLIISLFQTGKDKIVLDANQQAVFQVGDKYVVAYCTKVQEEGIAPIRDVVNDIRFALTKEKKADIISAGFIKDKQAGKSLDAIASQDMLKVLEATQINFRSYMVPGAGSETALIAAASASKQGVLEGPVIGDNGVFMLDVNNITTSAGEDLKALKARLTTTYEMRGGYEAYEALKKAANIVDKRYKFY